VLPPRTRRLLADESGMTLVEMLNVLVIMGILLLIATPSYLGLRDRSNQSAAKANLRAILPAVVLYGADNVPLSSNDPDGDPNDNGYTNLTPTLLQTHYDPTLDPTKYQVADATSTGYCVYTWVDAWTASKAGPDQPINVSLSSTFDPVSCS
jgi:prepilin-type N-terminal cleavage/methylation domain-containing protein